MREEERDDREEREEKRRLARVEELCHRAVRGEVVFTRFLTPRQARHIRRHLEQTGEVGRARFFGGYTEAERVCLFLFPDYVRELVPGDAWETASVPELLELAGEENPLCALDIRGSGYRTLTHRDYLGSLLALGIDREILGDILVGEYRAKVICLRHMIEFLRTDLSKIANDVVKVSAAPLPVEGELLRRFAPISDTVASARLDCVVAALANLSREVAQTTIRQGAVELDYEPEERVDVQITPPCVISVRGVGKFCVRSLGDPTRKGRWRLKADRYL